MPQKKTGTVIISPIKNADCVISKGMTNSSRFRKEGGVDLKQVMDLKTTSKEDILKELKYFIENDADDKFVKQWCLNIACELYTIFKTFKKDKIKENQEIINLVANSVKVSQTDREKALNWWNSLSNTEKYKLDRDTAHLRPGRGISWQNFTDREIENIWKENQTNIKSTALQVYKESVPMQIFFNKSSTTVNIIQTLDNLLKDVRRNIFELNEPYTATIVGYSNKNFTISSDEDFVEFTFEEIELL